MSAALRLFAAACIAALLTACGGSDAPIEPEPAAPTVGTIQVNCAASAVCR